MIYWTANSVPELRGLEKAEQKQLFAAMQKEGARRMGKSALWTRGLLALVLIFAIFFIFTEVIVLGGFLGGMVLGASIGLVAALLIQTPIIDKGREWLREQGHPKV